MLAYGGQDGGLQEAVAGLLVQVEAHDEGAGEDFCELAAQRLDAGGVEQALGALDDGPGVGAALALFLGDAGDAGQHEGGQLLGHLLDLDVVEDDERVLRAVGVVGRVGALLLLGFAVEQRRDELAGGGLARARRSLEAGHGPGAGEIDQQETGQPRDDQRARARGTGHIVEDQGRQQPVRLVGIGISQEPQRFHLLRILEDDAVSVASVFQELDAVGRNLGDLVLVVVEVEVDRVVRDIGVEPGEVLPHLTPRIRARLGRTLRRRCARPPRSVLSPVCSVEHGGVLALTSPVGGIHPVDGVVEMQERFAMAGEEELRAVGGEPVVGGLGGLGVAGGCAVLLCLASTPARPGRGRSRTEHRSGASPVSSRGDPPAGPARCAPSARPAPARAG